MPCADAPPWRVVDASGVLNIVQVVDGAENRGRIVPSDVQSASAHALPPNAEWIDLPPETARRHPLYGVSGWLVFFIFLFEFFIIVNIGNLAIPNPLYPIPNSYLILADTGFMLLIVAMILAKFDVVGPAVWGWVSFHFLGLIFAYSEFAADGAVGEQEKIIIAAYAIAFLLRDIPTAWYFTSSRRVNVTMNGRVRPNDSFLGGIDRPPSNGLDPAENPAPDEPAGDDPAPDVPDAFLTEARSQIKADYQTKECPACAETIKTQAVACRFCGYHFLNGGSPAASPNGGAPAEPLKGEIDAMIDTNKAGDPVKRTEGPVVMNSVGMVEYRGFYIAEMDSGKYRILSENGEKLKQSGDYDSSEYAMATLDYFITIAVELMSYPAALPKTN
ncbi:MAG: zinc ribbon domain-containing protein [Alphaproteobacteria bacterium]